MTFRHVLRKCILALPLSAMAANAALITSYTDPSLTLNANVSYSIYVNGSGNQTSATYLGTDPVDLPHTAFTAVVEDTRVLVGTDLDLSLSSTGPTGSRIESYFTGAAASAAYNPTFAVTRSPRYTIIVSSTAGTNSYSASGSVTDLNIFGLLNFATLLDASAANRSIVVSWNDTIDYLIPATMTRNALPGTNGPQKEYRWNVAASLTGAAALTLITSDPPSPQTVPEPASMVLIGSSFVILAACSRCRRNSRQLR
jgi:hypothetical protein